MKGVNRSRPEQPRYSGSKQAKRSTVGVDDNLLPPHAVGNDDREDGGEERDMEEMSKRAPRLSTLKLNKDWRVRENLRRKARGGRTPEVRDICGDPS